MLWKYVDSGFIRTTICVSSTQLLPFYKFFSIIFFDCFLLHGCQTIGVRILNFFFCRNRSNCHIFDWSNIYIPSLGDEWFWFFLHVNKIKHVRYVWNVSQKHFCTHAHMHTHTDCHTHICCEEQREREVIDRMKKYFG